MIIHEYQAKHECQMNYVLLGYHAIGLKNNNLPFETILMQLIFKNF